LNIGDVETSEFRPRTEGDQKKLSMFCLIFWSFFVNKITPGCSLGHTKKKGWCYLNNSNSTKKIQICAGNGKVVGAVYNGVFTKKIKGSKHILRKPPAIAFDVCTIEQAKEAGALRVQVTDIETCKVYSASLERVLEKGTFFNRGFGEQVFLPIVYWQLANENEPQAEQLTLFAFSGSMA